MTPRIGNATRNRKEIVSLGHFGHFEDESKEKNLQFVSSRLQVRSRRSEVGGQRSEGEEQRSRGARERGGSEGHREGDRKRETRKMKKEERKEGRKGRKSDGARHALQDRTCRSQATQGRPSLGRLDRWKISVGGLDKEQNCGRLEVIPLFRASRRPIISTDCRFWPIWLKTTTLACVEPAKKSCCTADEYPGTPGPHESSDQLPQSKMDGFGPFGLKIICPTLYDPLHSWYIMRRKLRKEIGNYRMATVTASRPGRGGR